MSIIGNPTQYQDFPIHEEVSAGSSPNVTLSWNPGAVNAIDVHVGGSLQSSDSYTLLGNLIILSETPLAGEKIIVKAKGIRALWQPRTKVSEYQVLATDGQTVFNTIYPYIVGTNSVAVYLNGSRLYSGSDYIETSNLSITLVVPAALDDSVLMISGMEVNGNAVDSDQVGFVPAGNISSSNVRDAMIELDTEKAPVSTTVTLTDSQTLSNKKLISPVLGASGTPANNFTLDASADNGTMKLARNSGQDIMTVDAAGKPDFTQLAKTFGASGSYELPGGLIIKWGTFTGGGSDPVITFPVAFPTDLYHVSLTAIADLSAGNSLSGTYAQNSNTSFKAIIRYANNGGDVGVSTNIWTWIAIGK